jgi:pimeloyl-ACP methyl ester carboxylesterase
MQQRICDSELQIIPGLKHSVLTEAPETIATMLLEFLARRP